MKEGLESTSRLPEAEEAAQSVEMPPVETLPSNEVSTETKYIYSGLFLDEESRDRLISSVRQLVEIPDSWTIIAHHMTTHHFTQDAQDVGQFNKSHLGEQFDIVATSLGISDKAIAVGIETEVPSTKDQKHVTIAIAEGARPVDSDDIKNWHSIQAIPLRTTLDEYIVPIDPSEEKVT